MRKATTWPVLLGLICILFASGAVCAEGVTYTYDNLGRLIRADAGNCSSTIEYEYDAVGNRLTKTETVQGNQPPYAPSEPWPPHEEDGVSPAVTLSWTGGDPCPTDSGSRLDGDELLEG